jgi:hypothetical protein
MAIDSSPQTTIPQKYSLPTKGWDKTYSAESALLLHVPRRQFSKKNLFEKKIFPLGRPKNGLETGRKSAPRKPLPDDISS